MFTISFVPPMFFVFLSIHYLCLFFFPWTHRQVIKHELSYGPLDFNFQNNNNNNQDAMIDSLNGDIREPAVAVQHHHTHGQYPVVPRTSTSTNSWVH